MVRVFALVPVVVICLAGAAVAQGSPAHYRTGQVTYRQGEEEPTLTLVPSGTFDVDTARHRRGATLAFAPGGKSGATPTFYLHFWASGGTPFIGALEVRGGEGGNAYFDKAESRCTLVITRLDAQAVEGSGACTGPFAGGGAPIVSFSFVAKQ
jgi:hypothetical protein